MRVAAVQKGESSVQAATLAVASMALAGLMAGAADAKVIMAQPELKKVFQNDGSVAAPKKAAAPSGVSASDAKAAPKPKAVEISTSGDIDVRVIALPAALAAAAGGYFVLTKVDAGFADFLYNAASRDSNEFAGFEPLLKAEGGYVPPTGTKKVKAAVKKGGLGGLFGKK